MPRRSERARREFLALGVGALLELGCERVKKGTSMSPAETKSNASREPVVFIGHGSPMNAIEDNRWARAFRELGQTLPKPRAVLSISAHWYVPGTFVTDNGHPETIHDFGGFPQQLFDVQYPAPGAPELAQRVSSLLGTRLGWSAAAARASLRSDWGLDHGTWSVLVHLLPQADVPVLQLSIDGRLPPAQHIEIGKAIAALRDEGVLILGSGNLTHNLRDAFANLRSGQTATPNWALDFDGSVAGALEQRDAATLAGALGTSAGRNAHPSPDHYLPLLYAFGASDERDGISYPVNGFDLGSLSMRAVRFG
jgi:4,5-DOPA dioxygenase extradiol